ncbi:MAG TPA: C45 family peptidase [Vicinamibacterales bacterium]|nr:C45 family peptidase [Vicinamibacterales bacterium]
MHRALTLAAAVLALGVAAARCSQTAAGAPAATPRADPRLDGSSRLERNGWIYVHLQGPPDELGYQHGYLLAQEIADLLRVVPPLLKQQTKKDWAFYRDAGRDMLWPKIDQEYQQELDGIVAGATEAGAKFDRWDIVALNALEELPGYYVPWLDKQHGKPPSVKSPEQCSAFVATGAYTRDHRVVMGHNAWTDYIVGSRWNIVFDLVPAKGHRIIMDGLPGVIVSDDDFGINSNGILITETTISRFEGFDPKGSPEFFRARKALQYSNSIDDYVAIMLDGNNGGYANDWLLADNKTGEVARFELGLKEHSVERTMDGYFVGSNFPVGKKLMANETHFNASNKGSSPNARRARWEQVMAEFKGQIDAEIGKRLESDAYDIIAKKDGPSERSLCGTVDSSPRGIPDWDWAPYYPGGTVQAKVTTAAMAEKMQLWAAMGHPCAPDFIASDFLKSRPQFGWARGLLRDMKTQPWTEFTSGMK